MDIKELTTEERMKLARLRQTFAEADKTCRDKEAVLREYQKELGFKYFPSRDDCPSWEHFSNTFAEDDKFIVRSGDRS